MGSVLVLCDWTVATHNSISTYLCWSLPYPQKHEAVYPCLKKSKLIQCNCDWFYCPYTHLDSFFTLKIKVSVVSVTRSLSAYYAYCKTNALFSSFRCPIHPVSGKAKEKHLGCLLVILNYYLDCISTKSVPWGWDLPRFTHILPLSEKLQWDIYENRYSSGVRTCDRIGTKLSVLLCVGICAPIVHSGCQWTWLSSFLLKWGNMGLQSGSS